MAGRTERIDVTRWIFLLRGVNVGGHNKVAMAPLREALAAAGFVEPRTYLQSGNIVASFDDDEATAIEAVRTVLTKTFDVGVPLMARTVEQLSATIAANPFPDSAAFPKLLHVGFCDPAPSSIDDIDVERFAPDRLAIANGELYFDYDKGVAGSKLTYAAMERSLGITVTARNWRTVNALVDLASTELGR